MRAPTPPLLPSLRRGCVVVALGVSLASGVADAEASPPPILSVQADHMVLDAALVGSRALLATQSGRVQLVELDGEGSLSDLLVLEVPEGAAWAPTVISLAASPDGQRVAVVSSDERLRLVEISSGRLLSSFDLVAGRLVRFLDDDHLLLGNMRGELALVRLSDRHQIWKRKLEYDPVHGVAVDPTGQRAAVAFRSSTIQIVDLVDGEPLARLVGHKDEVFGVAWLGEDRLVSAGKDKRLLSWDLAHPDEPVELYHGDDYVTAVATDLDSGSMAWVGEDRHVLVAGADGLPFADLSGHTAPIQVLSFFDHGQHLVSAGNDAMVMVWDLSSASQGAP